MTSNQVKMGLRILPFAFTESGVAMLSSVLNSDTAIAVNIQLIRVFSKLKESLLTNQDFIIRLEKLEKSILEHEKQNKKNEGDIQVILQALKQLIQTPNPPREPVGYKMKN